MVGDQVAPKLGSRGNNVVQVLPEEGKIPKDFSLVRVVILQQGFPLEEVKSSRPRNDSAEFGRNSNTLLDGVCIRLA